MVSNEIVYLFESLGSEKCKKALFFIYRIYLCVLFYRNYFNSVHFYNKHEPIQLSAF